MAIYKRMKLKHFLTSHINKSEWIKELYVRSETNSRHKIAGTVISILALTKEIIIKLNKWNELFKIFA